MAFAPQQRSFTAGKFLFGFDGTPCGYLQKFDGGNAKVEVVNHNSGGLAYRPKNATIMSWDGLKCTTGAGMSKGLYEWIQQSFKLNCDYKNGYVQSLDFNHRVHRECQFFTALMTKCAFPKLSGDGKDATYLQLEFKPERVTWNNGGGQVVNALTGDAQKNYHVANWRFEMAGLPAKRVHSIEGLSWECKTVLDQCGDAREYTCHPVEAVVADIKVSFSSADAEAWAQKAYDFLVRGNCLAEHEMSASVTLMSPNFGQEIATVSLMRVGFKSFSTAQAREANAEGIERCTAELYIEAMDLALSTTNA
jgi:hypothetical protein